MDVAIKVPYSLRFNKVGSSDLGYISVAEYQDQIPFEIRRVYWTYFTPEEVSRGHHAHYELEQVLVALSGKIKIELESPVGELFSFELTKPDQGLFIPKLFWRILHFEHSSVLLCLASDIYKQADYIRDYDKFKSIR